jgi:hypothetical protein
MNLKTQFLSSSQVITHKMLKYLKLVKIAMVQVLGSIKDKIYFSDLNFIKSKLHNWLTTHLNLVVKMFAQNFYILIFFPWPQAIVSWKGMWLWYGFQIFFFFLHLSSKLRSKFWPLGLGSMISKVWIFSVYCYHIMIFW